MNPGVSAERPLAGVRVIDLSSFIAGPVVSRHLAMLGADVVKVEPPTGDPFRTIGPPFLSWNQGKRSIALDLTTDEGRHDLHRLAATADIVVENFRPGVAERLGADQEALAEINPHLVFLSSPGYGLDASMAERPAFDPLIQALGGFMAAQGGIGSIGPGGDPSAEPVFLTVPIHDVVTPIVGALGLVLGLWQRERTGTGQQVRTSLVQSTMVAQAAEFTRFDGRPPAALGGFDHPGPDPNHTWHPSTSDGGDGGGGGDDDSLVWRDGEHEVPVCRIGLTSDQLGAANELTVNADYPEHGRLITFGQLVGGAGPPPHHAPMLDEHRAEILAELDPD